MHDHRYAQERARSSAAPAAVRGDDEPPIPAPCISVREIVVHVRGSYRRGSAKVAGRTFRFTATRDRARVAIDLTGLAKGTYRVRIELRSRSGRTVKQVPTYRTSLPGPA